MKFRTDFVTNSSSSSFVVARIRTTSKELVDAIEAVRETYEYEGEYFITNGKDTIEIDSRESALGFSWHYPDTPSDVITVLLEYIDELEECYEDDEDDENYEQYASLKALCTSLKNNRMALADSITEYHIEVGEEGNSSEAECLWEEYREYASAHPEDDEDDYDWYDGWVLKKGTYDYKKGQPSATYSVNWDIVG